MSNQIVYLFWASIGDTICYVYNFGNKEYFLDLKFQKLWSKLEYIRDELIQ